VAVDIGCLECGESSKVLGVFTMKMRAEAVCEEHEARQKATWHGQHSFEVFEISGIDEEQRLEYS
jgi:hypothetical protein